MLSDQRTKSEISRDWGVVRSLCTGSHRQWQVPGGPFINETRPAESYNLPLVLAFAVLDRVLNEFRDQDTFSCSKWQLGNKMAAARNALPWQNYDLVDEGRNKRNEIAHEATLFSKPDCLRYIDAVEAELKAWGLV